MIYYVYLYSILGVGIIIIGLFISYLYFGGLNPVISATGGLLFSVPIKFFWLAYTRPILEIKGIESAKFNPGDIIWEYVVNRIIVKNSGRSSAKNCKGYIGFGEKYERVCWTVPKERPNATINVKDNERLDFYALYISGPFEYLESYRDCEGSKEKRGQIPKVIAPTEMGWVDPWKCRILDGIDVCKVRITADNAEPIETDIRINAEKN